MICKNDHLLVVTVLVVPLIWLSQWTADAARAEDAAREIASRGTFVLNDQSTYVRWQHRFRLLSDETLHELLESDDDSSAVTAAWELYVRRPAYRHGSTRRGEAGVITELGVRKFVVFCEGRLHIAFPDWYGGILQSGAFSEWQGIPYPSFPDPTEPPAVKLSKGFFTVQERDVKISGDDVVLRGKSSQLKLSSKNLRSRGGSSDVGLAFTSDRDRFWVTSYDGVLGSENTVERYDAGERRKWTSKIWAQIDDGYYSGEHYHYAFVQKRDGRVYVVGIGGDGAYIEGFDAKNGAAEMRFLSRVFPSIAGP